MFGMSNEVFDMGLVEMVCLITGNVNEKSSLSS